jgi:ATP-binding cassette subfamily F protein 3
MLMLLRPANLLLLDEPTNHLDMEAQDVLLAALKAYQGTVVFVSHDHDFIERLATRVIEVGGRTISSFPGDYESYLWRKARDAESAAAAALAPVEPHPPPTERAMGVERAKGRDTGRRTRRIGMIEEKIAALEDRRVKLEDLMGTEGFFKEPERSRFYLEEHRQLGEELHRLYVEWQDLSEEDL